MSEYQYYEFRAVDRPLTSAQMAELRKVSSRGDITPASYSNVYNYGNFKGDPKTWMELYFDAFLHLTNWGTRWLMLRVPASLVDEALVRRYLGGETSEVWTSGRNLILSFRLDEEEPEWEEEDEERLSTIAMLREDLIRGDHRCLYLAWLLNARWCWTSADDDESDDLRRAEEPPIPPGLGELSEPLWTFADFMLIDSDLIAAAAERSPAMRDRSIPKEEIARWVTALPVEEKDAIVLRLLDDDAPHQAIELRRRMERELREAERSGDSAAAPPRTLGELIERAESLAEERRREEAARRAKAKARKEREAAKKRRTHLESLVGQEDCLLSLASLDDLNVSWYGYLNNNPAHYDSSRYHSVNLHSVWYRHTLEYRLFAGTLHAGKVKAYVQFALAMSARALKVKSTSSKRRAFDPATAKYDFRCLLLALGMVGDEFKTARKHLLANLEGSAAWKHGRPQAIAA